MAVPPSSRIASNTLLSNESRNSSTHGKPYRLPNGPCNFTNLTVGGASPPRCGCQRFWDQLEHTQTTSGKELGGVTRDQPGFCHCSHHACYHDLLPTRSFTSQQVGASGTLRLSSQHSKRGESSLSNRFPSQNTECHISQSRQASTSDETDTAGIHGGKKTQSQANKHLTESGLPDTGLSDRQRQSDSIAPGLPPIPSQCYLPPDISSGGISGHSQSFQSFPGVKGNLSVGNSPNDHAPQSNRSGQNIVSPLQIFTSDQLLPSGVGEGDSFVQSATELLTPSPRRSPDPGSESKFEHHVASLQSVLDILVSNGRQVTGSKLLGEINELSSIKDGAVDGLSIGQPGPPQLADECGPSGHSPSNITAIAIRPTTEVTNLDTLGGDGLGLLLARPTLFHLESILKHVSAHPTLSTRVQNHEQRIDLLENVSCSYASAQEVHEGFDLADERIGEVESRVEELEKVQAAMNDVSGVSSFRRRLQYHDDVNSSMASQTSSELISAAIERTEFSSRLDTLESQFSEFRSSTLPSYAHPWKVEVVFLPFGTALKGIWSTADQFPSQRSRNNSMFADNQTQSQNSNVVGRYAQKSLETGQRRWEDLYPQFDITDDLLVARACGQRSKVEERLRSRGLVKTIEVTGPGARDVQSAMLAVFGDLPEILQTSTSTDHQLPDSLACFYGLRSSWIPLRKLHKDSRLRFLDPSEMITPALWTASFLSSSVVMRATGVKRLYVTQSESYLQQEETANINWTWQKLRVLPRVYPDAESSAEVREGDAREACWEWDGRLDPPQSTHSSFTSQHSSLSIRAAPSQHSDSSQSEKSSSPAVSPVLSTTPTSVTHTRQISPLMEKPRPLHLRTTSMPLIGPLKLSPPPGKRRITSFDHEIHGPSSPQSSPIRPSAGLTTKRRRISRSPSRPRDTPRWSVGPPSPYYFEEPVEQKRGTTPFAYATPHSNAPYVDFRPHSVTGMALDGHDDHGSITDELGRDEEEHDVDEFDSEADQERQPEDEDWKGIRDELADDESDQEQKALSIEGESDDAMSDLSSQPSEYPSTQPSAFYATTKGAFQIHVDEDEEQDAYDRPRTS
jgi:hypothetical protein